jgi:hypothetical protein
MKKTGDCGEKIVSISGRRERSEFTETGGTN